MTRAGPVLVTGVNGQLGHALQASVDMWRPVDADVVFVGRGELDLADARQLRHFLEELAPRLILNAAAYTAVDRAESDADNARAVNTIAPAVMAEHLSGNGGALIHVSTDYVFDGQAKTPYREDAPTGPLSVYGATKLAGEDAVRASGAAHWILRTSWVYSASGANFLKTMMRLAETRETIAVVADQRGAPTDAKRLAWFIGGMLRPGGVDAVGIDAMVARVVATCGTYHATAAGETTWHAYARHVVAGLQSRTESSRWKLAPDAITETTTAQYVTPAKRPLYSLLDHARFVRTFDLVPPPWQQDVDACLDALVGRAC